MSETETDFLKNANGIKVRTNPFTSEIQKYVFHETINGHWKLVQKGANNNVSQSDITEPVRETMESNGCVIASEEAILKQ